MDRQRLPTACRHVTPDWLSEHPQRSLSSCSKAIPTSRRQEGRRLRSEEARLGLLDGTPIRTKRDVTGAWLAALGLRTAQGPNIGPGSLSKERAHYGAVAAARCLGRDDSGGPHRRGTRAATGLCGIRTGAEAEAEAEAEAAALGWKTARGPAAAKLEEAPHRSGSSLVTEGGTLQ